MPKSIVMRGVVFAAPTAPGYTPGVRVVVTATFEFSDAQIAAIDTVTGGSTTVASVALTNVKYILTTGTNAQNVSAPATTNTVEVGIVQAERSGDGKRTFRALLTDKSGNSYHSGSVVLSAFESIGTNWSAPPPTVGSADTAEPGYGLYCQFWMTRNFVGGAVADGHHAINFADPGFGWPGADADPEGVLMTTPRISIRAVGFIRIPSAGTWRIRVVFKLRSGVDAWLDAVRFISVARGSPAGYETQEGVSPWAGYTAGQMVPFRLDFTHNYTPHAVRLEWEKQGTASAVIPATALYSSPEVGTIRDVPPPDQVEWYLESVNRYQES